MLPRRTPIIALKSLLAAHLLAALLLMLPAAAAQTQNPILRHPDPFITFQPVAGQYLLLATTGRNISLWYGPTPPTAARQGRVVFRPRDGLSALWSPTLWNLEGRWWIYFTAQYPSMPHAIFALQSDSDDPLGSYTFQGQIQLDHPAIDPSLLTLAGKTYLMYVSVDEGENDLRMIELPHPLQTAGKSSLITHPDKPWEKAGPGHSPVTEGPTALYHDGKTFIVYSGSDTRSPGYCLGLLTYLGGDPLKSKSWSKTGPVFQADPAHGIFGPGRGTFAMSPDGSTYWLLYHARSTEAPTLDGRATRAQRFTWNPDGSPNFGIPQADGPIQDDPANDAPVRAGPT